VEASSKRAAQRAPVDIEASSEERRPSEWPVAIAIFGPALVLYVIAGIVVYWLIGIL
jgi:hypothetical protein